MSKLPGCAVVCTLAGCNSLFDIFDVRSLMLGLLVTAVRKKSILMLSVITARTIPTPSLSLLRANPSCEDRSMAQES